MRKTTNIRIERERYKATIEAESLRDRIPAQQALDRILAHWERITQVAAVQDMTPGDFLDDLLRRELPRASRRPLQ